MLWAITELEAPDHPPPPILVTSELTQTPQVSLMIKQLDFHPRQRPGDKDLELDEKRTEECWQQVKQELGMLSEGATSSVGLHSNQCTKRGCASLLTPPSEGTMLETANCLNLGPPAGVPRSRGTVL